MSEKSEAIKIDVKACWDWVKDTVVSSFVPKKGIDFKLAVYVGIILIMGFVYTSSAQMGSSTTVASTIRSAVKELIIIGLGVLVFNYLSNKFSLEKLRKGKVIKWAWFEAGLLMAAVIYCMIFGKVNGNRSWINIFGFGIQPSEFSKLMMILIVAVLLCDRHFPENVQWWEVLLRPAMFLALYGLIIVVLQGDMGSAMVMAVVSAIVVLIPNHKKLHGFQIFVVCGILLAIPLYCSLYTEVGRAILAKVSRTFAARFEAVVNPSYYSDNTREIFYSLLGISKGGLLGVGLGAGVQKYGYLVSSDADYIFAVIAEETGMLGILLVFGIYFLIISRLLYFAKRVDKEGEKVVLIGTVAYLGVHFLFNIGGVSGLIALTGVPLLLLSRGGSSTLSIMMMLGMSQSIIADYLNSKKQQNKNWKTSKNV